MVLCSWSHVAVIERYSKPIANKAVNLFSQLFFLKRILLFMFLKKTNLRVTFIFLGAIIHKTSNILFMFFKKEQTFCYKEVVF